MFNRGFWVLQDGTLRTHCVCLESLSVMSRMRNVAVWFVTHATGSSISGNISHSASLTPSARLQYPHFFHLQPPPPLALLLLFTGLSLTTRELLSPFLSTAALCYSTDSYVSFFLYLFNLCYLICFRVKNYRSYCWMKVSSSWNTPSLLSFSFFSLIFNLDTVEVSGLPSG